MARTYPMPMWGITMEEGVVHEWVVAVGDRVTEGQVLGTVGTTKAEIEFESPATGVVAALLAQVGETVAVGADLIVIAEDEADAERYQTTTA